MPDSATLQCRPYVLRNKTNAIIIALIGSESCFCLETEVTIYCITAMTAFAEFTQK